MTDYELELEFLRDSIGEMYETAKFLAFASGAISNASKRGQRDIGGTKFKVLGGLNEQMEDNTSGG